MPYLLQNGRRIDRRGGIENGLQVLPNAGLARFESGCRGQRTLIRANERQSLRNGLVDTVASIGDSGLQRRPLWRGRDFLSESLHCQARVERHTLGAEVSWRDGQPRIAYGARRIGIGCARICQLAQRSALCRYGQRGTGRPIHERVADFSDAISSRTARGAYGTAFEAAYTSVMKCLRDIGEVRAIRYALRGAVGQTCFCTCSNGRA